MTLVPGAFDCFTSMFHRVETARFAGTERVQSPNRAYAEIVKPEEFLVNRLFLWNSLDCDYFSFSSLFIYFRFFFLLSVVRSRIFSISLSSLSFACFGQFASGVTQRTRKSIGNLAGKRNCKYDMRGVGRNLLAGEKIGVDARSNSKLHFRDQVDWIASAPNNTCSFERARKKNRGVRR